MNEIQESNKKIRDIVCTKRNLTDLQRNLMAECIKVLGEAMAVSVVVYMPKIGPVDFQAAWTAALEAMMLMSDFVSTLPPERVKEMLNNMDKK